MRRFAAPLLLSVSLAAVALLPGCSGGRDAPEPPPAPATSTESTRPPDPGPLQITVNNAQDFSRRPNVRVNRGAVPTELQTQDLIVGTGRTAAAQDTVTVQYIGAIARNGEEFIASWDNGGPVTKPLSDFVPGFAQGVVGMREGGRRTVVIPPALGYGEQGSGTLVGPNETLLYVVDLIKID